MTKTKLPADFPITPLGTSDGLYYFLSNGGSVRAFRPRELSRNEVAALAGSRLGYLLRKFPKPSAAKGKGTRNAYGFDVARVVDLLLVACEEAGTFDPESIRDVGAWPGAEGELVLHRGDHLLVRGRTEPIGRRGEHVYVRGKSLPPILLKDAPASAVQALLEALESWRFKHAIGPLLVLGWAASALVGGALRIRPLLALVGEPQAAKTALLDFLELLLGGRCGVLRVAAPTEAGLRQAIDRRTLPVLADEKTPDPPLLAFARISFGGDTTRRGGDDHHSVAFLARCSLAVACITLPPMGSQDRSRWAELRMLELTEDDTLPDLRSLAGAARIFGARVANGFTRLRATTVPFQERLLARGWSPRGAEVFAILLGMAHLVLDDTAPEAGTVSAWVDQLEPWRELHDADRVPVWQECLTHILSLIIDPDRQGRPMPVGRLVRHAYGWGDSTHPPPRLAMVAGEPVARPVIRSQEMLMAEERLGMIGLRVVEVEGQSYLAIANQHAMLAQLLERSPWANGAWREALRGAPGARGGENPTTFSRAVKTRVTLVPMSLVLDGLADDD
jgi:putative DNA primase/helicase